MLTTTGEIIAAIAKVANTFQLLLSQFILRENPRWLESRVQEKGSQ
jgi:hypothetical protein